MKDKPVPKPILEYHSSKISRLSNSIYYGLDTVILLQEENVPGYRLIFHHGGAIIVDLAYGTVRGARIAFSKYCESRAYTDEVVAEWTHPYFPEKEWLDAILSSPRKLVLEEKTPKVDYWGHDKTQTTSPDLDKKPPSLPPFLVGPKKEADTSVFAEMKVAVLNNKHHYKLNDVIIIHNPQDVKTPYWLLITHLDNQMEKKAYQTLRGLKISFAQRFKNKIFIPTTPEWTELYPPEADWLKEKMANIPGFSVEVCNHV